MSGAWLLVGLALAGPADAPSAGAPAVTTGAAAVAPVGDAPGRVLDDAARLSLARTRLLDAERRSEALVTLARLLDADDAAVAGSARSALAEALLASPPDPAWVDVARRLSVGAPPDQARALVARARAKARPVRRERIVPARAAEAAWKRSPKDPAVAWAVARARVERRPAEALAPARVALAARPWDPDRLDVLRRAAAAAGEADEAVARARAALQVVRTPAERQRLVQSLLWAYGDVARTASEAGDPLAAYHAHVEALTLAASHDALRGAAGAAWAAGRLDEAWNFYVAFHEAGAETRSRALALAELALATDLVHPDRLQVASASLAGLDPGKAGSPERAEVEYLVGKVARARESLDARRASGEGRHADALVLWDALDRAWPDSSEPGRARANALAALGRNEEALAVWQELTVRFHADPWITMGTCHALLSLGRVDEARGRLAPLREQLEAAGEAADAELWRGVREVEGHALRRDTAAALAAGDTERALALARDAVSTEPGAWSSINLGGVLLARGEFEAALGAYEAASSADPALVDAAIGRAVALGRLTREREGFAILDAFASGCGTCDGPAVRAARARLESDLALREGIALADAGRLEDAVAALSGAAVLHADRADLLSALASVQLRRGDAGAAFQAALAALRREPASEWAARSLVDAGRAAGRAREAATLLRTEGRVPDALVTEATLDATLEEALNLPGSRRARAIARAEALAGSARTWNRVGAAWLEAGKPDRARAAYARALALDAGDRDAARGSVRALLAAGRLEDAWVHAREAARKIPDAELALGGAEARVRARRGEEVTALLAQVAGTGTPRQVAVAQDLMARGRAESGVRGGAAVAVVDRRGAVGTTGLRAVLTPAQVFVPAPALARGSRIGVQAWTITLQDELPTDTGGSIALGWDTAPDARWSVAAHVGSSPIGFEGAPYLVGAARVGFRPAPAWNVGWEVARAPRTDTRAAWVGTVFPETRQLYGRVSHVWTAVEASAGGVGWDLGGVARVGYVEGIGVAPNPMAETVAWTGRTFGDPSARVQARFVRVGVDGIAMSYERREDGLVPGQGGYFSPGFFGSAMARVSGVSAGRGRALCGGLALGVRHQSAGDNVFDATGTGASVAANAGAAWRLGGDLRLQADARGERATTGWQQVAGLVRLTNGGRGTSVSPSPSALGAPGLGLPRPDELCDILP